MAAHWQSRWRPLTCAIPILMLLSEATGSAQPAGIYPGKTWESRLPSQVGMDKGKLRAFSELVGGSGCLVRHGYLVACWGKWQERSDVASAAKPLYSHFLFKAIEDGRIPHMDDRVVGTESALGTINKQLGFKDRAITWRHLANQTACYGVSEQPGSAFVYNDWQMALFFDTLFGKVYRADHASVDDKVLHPLLTSPIECEDAPTFMAFGLGDRPGRLAISPRDFARFGLLYLREGRWQGRQLLSPGFVRMAIADPLPNSLPRTSGRAGEMLPGQRTIGSLEVPDNQCDHGGSYSWLWWVNGVDRTGKRNWPGAPLDSYAALGHGGEEGMAVIPSLDLVVSWNNARVPGGAMSDDALKLITASVLDADPMADQITVDSRCPSWLGTRSGRPFFICGPGDPEDFLYRGKRNPDGTRDGDQVQLIRKLACTSANCIYMTAILSHGGDGDATQNPFLDSDPAKGLNDRVLDQWEQWFTEMDRNGIAIFLTIYDDSARVWDTGDIVSQGEREFVSALVSRFKHHRSLIWCVAEEYEEALTPERVRQLAATIRRADEHAHPIAVHKLPGLDFSEFADDPNIDQFAMQYTGTARELHDGIVKSWRQARGRYNLNMAEAAGFGSGEEARRKLWACAMAGAYAMVLGMDIASTPLSDLEDCGGLVRFMRTVDHEGMSPHDELAAGGTQYVLASAGDDYVLYSCDVKDCLGLKGVQSGSYELNWFDCVTHRWVIQPHVATRGGVRSWTKPAGLGNEVALHVRREQPG